MKRNNRGRQIFSYFLLAVGAFIFILPYFYMIVASTQDNAQIIGGGVNFKFGTPLWTTCTGFWSGTTMCA